MIRQDETAGLDAQDIFVGRTVLNVGSRTQVGAIATDGNPQCDLDNSLVGADFRYRNTNFHGNTVELSRTTKRPRPKASRTTTTPSYGVNFFLPNARAGRPCISTSAWRTNFFPALGYVNVNDIEDHHLTVGYRHFFYTRRLRFAPLR